MTLVARDRRLGFGTVCPFTHDTGHFALVSLFVGIVFQASRTKVSQRKEAGYVGDGMKMTIVDQVNVDTGSLVGARASNKFVA